MNVWRFSWWYNLPISPCSRNNMYCTWYHYFYVLIIQMEVRFTSTFPIHKSGYTFMIWQACPCGCSQGLSCLLYYELHLMRLILCPLLSEEVVATWLLKLDRLVWLLCPVLGQYQSCLTALHYECQVRFHHIFISLCNPQYSTKL